MMDAEHPGGVNITLNLTVWEPLERFLHILTQTQMIKLTPQGEALMAKFLSEELNSVASQY